MKKHLSTFVLILIFVTGVSLLLYPTISDYWNSFHQSKAIASYEKKVAEYDDEAYDQLFEEAHEYNNTLLGQKNRFYLSEKEQQTYESVLNITGTGIIGYIRIENINCELPIYHGTDEAVLQIAVGHIPGTSLPVGGESTHCVVSGHRGLPSARLFTDLDQVVVGDHFMLHVLGETLTYEVDQILIVEPEDTGALEIEEGKDYCTLITCTPYGVNSHRLLVRGHRVENIDDASIRVTADARQFDPVLVAPIVAVPILFFLLIVLLIKYRKR